MVDIANVYKWSLRDIKKLYLDDKTLNGLSFWHENAKDYIKQIGNTGL